MGLMVFYIFEEGDQRWAQGFWAGSLSHGFSLQCRKGLIQPLAVMVLIELSKGRRLHLWREGRARFRQWPFPALFNRSCYIFIGRGPISHCLAGSAFDESATAFRSFGREYFQREALCVDPNGAKRAPKRSGVFPPVIEVVLQPFQGRACLQRLMQPMAVHDVKDDFRQHRLIALCGRLEDDMFEPPMAEEEAHSLEEGSIVGIGKAPLKLSVFSLQFFEQHIFE
jgi:hypothetical protein